MRPRLVAPRRSGRGRPLRLLFWCALAVLLLGAPVLASGKPALRDTVEWGRLVSLWHLLLDHSSGAVYSIERFKESAPSLTRADEDITALVSQKLLSAEIGEGLRRVLHSRYAYVQDHCYTNLARTSQTALEAAESASRWIVEMQLSLLRQQRGANPPDRKLLEAIRANLTHELTFQQGLTDLMAEQARRREALTKKEAEKEGQVDWNRFEVESVRQSQTLLEAYQQRRLPRKRAVSNLVPYLVDLTQAPVPDATADHPSSGR